jgi:hypothetical protein
MLQPADLTEPYLSFLAFYHLNFSYFSGKDLWFCLELASDCDPSTYGSEVDGMTGAYHHVQFID